MTLGNVQFFTFGVSFKLDELKAVKQRARNLGDIICGADEQDIAQVECLIEIVVGEAVVLLRI